MTARTTRGLGEHGRHRYASQLFPFIIFIYTYIPQSLITHYIHCSPTTSVSHHPQTHHTMTNHPIGSSLNHPAHSWLLNLSLLNASSLMAMRQASSSFLHLIDNSDDLWNNLAINLPSSHLNSKHKHDAFMELTAVLHKGTNLTPAKHKHIS